jgi:hypothetical protein
MRGLLGSKQTRTGIANLMVFLSLECHFHGGVGSVRSVGRVGAQGCRFPPRGGGVRFDRRDDGVRAGERFGRARGGFAGHFLLILDTV